MKSIKVPIKTTHDLVLKCPYIQFMWEMNMQDFELPNLTQTVIPSLYIDIIFPLDGFLHDTSDNIFINDPFVTGILHNYKIVKFIKGSRIFGIRLSLLFARSLMKMPLSALKQLPNLISDVLPRQLINELKPLVYNSNSFNERVNLIDNLFFNKEVKLEHKTNKTICALSYMNHKPTSNVSTIAKEMGYTTRWVEKRIMNELGTTPTQLFSINRINRFIQYVKQNPTSKLTELALSAGYYDQSHLIREFKKFGGTTPLQYRKNITEFNKTMNHL